jgi:hypothetical protein
MSWKQLLAQRKVQLHTTSKQELDGLRALIERDLTDAALAGLSADRRFATRIQCCAPDRQNGHRLRWLPRSKHTRSSSAAF